jgi:hypothetical protein
VVIRSWKIVFQADVNHLPFLSICSPHGTHINLPQESPKEKYIVVKATVVIMRCGDDLTTLSEDVLVQRVLVVNL